MKIADFSEQQVLSEDREQQTVVEYCRMRNLPIFHVPNSTYTKSPKIKNRNTRLGVSAGVPDLFVITPMGMLAIEMKRRKGSSTTKHQKQWIEILQRCPAVEARICKGADEAIDFINQYI